ncbi:MAG: hypothetical protein KC731_16240 [Myxococcales bacterium]|nr:hypothetical protein [Myxococcales bacterium]
MSRYMDSFPILITPDSRAWVDTLPAPASTEPGRPALLFRDGSTDRWRVVTDGSACPGDASTDLGHLGLSTSTSR